MTTIGMRGAMPGMRAGATRMATKVPWIGPRVAIRAHRAGLGAPPCTWSEIADLVAAERPDRLSVDVFDTCVIRDLLGDEPIELVLARRVEESPSPSTVDRVELAGRLEAALCRPVPGVVEALDRIRAAGVAITFLSDTERSSASLRSMLAAHDIHRDGDELVASTESGATKSAGDLFAKVWSAEEREPGALWHVGNNLWSDVTMAEQAGLRAFPITAADPTRYEAAMAVRPSTAGPAVAAAARRARLAIEAELPEAPSALQRREARLETLGADVAGQALSAFVLWVADQARQEELPQLLFLSRDGELPLRIATAMPADHWDGVALGYAHCSRWSWFLAGAACYGIDTWLQTGTADAGAFIHSHRGRVPFESLLGRIGLTAEDLGGHPALAQLPLDRPLPEDRAVDWDAMLADPSIGEVILARSQVRKDLIVRYLQSLDLVEGRIGLVDVGWRGRLAWAMSPILAEVTGEDPLHLHVGGDKVFPDVDETVEIRRFAFDGTATEGRIANPVSCVETMTASGRARVVGYEPAEGGVEPVFEREVAEIDNADRRRLWAGALRVASLLPSRKALVDLGCTDDALGAESVEVLSQWWNEPERLEAEAMQGLSFEADDDGRSIAPLVMPYSPRELSPEGGRSRQWQQGSAALSSRTMGVAVDVFWRARSRLRGVRSPSRH